jgi:1,4-alpha-glucan branching enzyme
MGLGELDLHLAGEGRHERIYEQLGAHLDDDGGVRFAVWAPNARAVAVVGDWNGWRGDAEPLEPTGSSGIWQGRAAAAEGDAYKFAVLGADGVLRLKADPYAFRAEVPPRNASLVYRSRYEWGDDEWLEQRRARDPLTSPHSVYEVHAGSWRQGLGWRGLADELAGYVADLGFTHVELMPVMQHPFSGSWGYQVSGYYAPQSTWGEPDDLRALVDALHALGIGVVLDWVPAHFPRDDWALARFDGTALYEHADPRRGAHPDWGTLVFNLSRHEVRNFLLANALYWLREFHADGLRVDAVASMLYLDYSRGPGQWVPNELGGRENLEAVSFLQDLNTIVHAREPGAFVAAEESTAWPGVSRPAEHGGLGFTFKWNMGWMHDTLSYFAREPVHRRFHHNDLTFSMIYAWDENFVLPLSHDEVVHGKGSLLQKLPGDRWQQLANLRALYALQWAHPGKQLLFMGGELAQPAEWNVDGSLDWWLLENPDHAGVLALVRDANRVYREEPALWELDFAPDGFAWLEANAADDNVAAFVRWSFGRRRALVCIANLSPVVRERWRIGLPAAGRWREALNTDSRFYAGSDVGNGDCVEAEEREWNGQPWSAELVLPPLATLWLVPGVPPLRARRTSAEHASVQPPPPGCTNIASQTAFARASTSTCWYRAATGVGRADMSAVAI